MPKSIYILPVLLLIWFVRMPAASADSLLLQYRNDPDNSAIMKQLSEHYYATQQYNQAVKWAREAIEHRKTGREEAIRLHLLLGKIYLAMPEAEKAGTHLQKVVQAHVHDSLKIQSMRMLGDVHKQQNNFEQSRTWYDRAYALAGDANAKAELLNLIGSLYWQQGLYYDAIAIYDSALNALDHKPGMLTLRILNNKAACYREVSEFTLALAWHDTALAMADQIKDTVALANTFNLIGSTYYRNNKNDSALIYYRRTHHVYKTRNDSSGLYTAVLNLARVHEKLQAYDSALVYNQQAMKLIDEQREVGKAISVHNNLGDIYFELGKYSQSAWHYFNSLQLAHKNDDNDELLARTYSRLSRLYSRIGDFERALEYLQVSIEHTTQTGNKPQLAYRIHQTGNLYFNNGYYNNALEAYQRALTLHEALQDQKSMAQTINNIGNAYRELGNYKEALRHYRQAYSINRQLKDHTQEAYTLNNLGNVFQLLGDQNQALQYYTEAYDLSKSHRVRFIHGLVARKLGEHYKNTADYAFAGEYLQESLEIGRQINHSTLIKNALFQLYELALQRKNYYEALTYYREFATVDKQMAEEANDRRITEQQLHVELEQTRDTIQYIESALHDSRQQQALKTLEAQKYKEQRLYLVIIILVFLVAGAVITYLFFQLRQKKRMLDDEYKKSTLANLKLKKSETVLKELVATKDKFFSIIAHDLRGPIASLMNLTGVLSDHYDELTDEELKEANESIHESAENLYTLLENLLHWSRIQTGRIHYEPIRIEMQEVVQQNIELLKIAAHEKSIQVTSDIQPNTVVKGDREMIDTVFRNLINNAIKFTNKDGGIHITATSKDDRYWVFSIKDNGVGMDEEVLNNLFRVDKQVSMSGTNNESGTGLGLILCKEFIKKNNGEIWVESKINEGTTFYFTLPTFAKKEK